MSDYNYEDFPFEKDVSEWTDEELEALFDEVADIDDDLAAALGRQESEDREEVPA